jgi:cell division protein FtsL
MAKQIEYQDTDTEVKERRYVYNGDTVAKPDASEIRGNRRVRTKKRSPIKWLFGVAMISTIVVFYIWNKISADKLSKEISDLEKQHHQISNVNEILRAEINQKSRLERIGKIATEQLGMLYPKQQPIWFQVPQQDVNQDSDNK